MNADNGPATSSVLESGESLDPLGDPPQSIQRVTDVDRGMQDAAENLSLGTRPTSMPSSNFLVESDLSAMAAPSQEVKRSLFSSFGTSRFGSSFKSAITSAKRETTRTPVFSGFSKTELPQVSQQEQSSLLGDYAQPTLEETETSTSLSTNRKRKANSPLLGLFFLTEPSSICGAPIGNSGRFACSPK